MVRPGRTRRPLVVASGVGLVAVAWAATASVPRLMGVTWSEIGARIASVPPGVLLLLLALWATSLLVHAPVLMAALPGLTLRQALTLNLAGSSVSNVLPFGGPAGMSLGYAMTRTWGFRSDAFASFTVATNLWNAVGKFLASIVVLTAAAALGVALPAGIASVVLSAGVFVILALGSAVATFCSERATAAVGRRLDRLLGLLHVGTSPARCSTWFAGMRADLLVAVRLGWRRMTLGVATYLFLQASLLFACLAAVGAHAGAAVVAVAFAIERLISLAPVTPGAAGLAELGTTAALTWFGVGPVEATAGVLLYRLFMFAIEIPVGGVLTLAWVRRRRAIAVDRERHLTHPRSAAGRGAAA